MKDLLAQREGIARKKQEMEALQKEEEEERERVRLQARERVLSGGTLALFGKRKEREEAKDGQCQLLNHPSLASHSLFKTRTNPQIRNESSSLMRSPARN